MTALAAHLVDEVIPKVPTRQWVLSLPIRFRYLLAYNHDLCREVVKIFNRVVNQFYRQQGEPTGTGEGNTGSVTFIQRGGGALNLNVHFHATFIDGIFLKAKNREDKSVTFYPAKEPTDQQIALVLSQVRFEVLCHLRDRGLLDFDFDSDSLAEESPLLAACYNASAQNRVAFGSRAGQTATCLGRNPHAKNGKQKDQSRGKLHAHLDGFDLHARQYIPAKDRKQLERALRYCARPPISEDRLEQLSDGRISLRLKTPYYDGATHLALGSLELLEKLAALIPRPRVNLLLYHGVLAPNAALRKAVVAYGREPTKQEVTPVIEQDQLEILARLQAEVQPGSYMQIVAQQPTPTGSNYTWSSLMARAFEMDVLKCDNCNGRLRFIACITKREAITAILRHLGLPDTPPEIAPARSPPTAEYGDTLFDVA
jgi:hypothetical protein